MEGNDTNDTNISDNVDFSQEYLAIQQMDAGFNLSNQLNPINDSICGLSNPISNFTQIFNPEIKIDNRFTEQLSSLMCIKNELLNNASGINNLSEESYSDFDDKYKVLQDSVKSFVKDMSECRSKLTDLENKIVEKEKENKKDVDLVQTFLNFVVNVKESTEEEIVTESFKEEIVTVCEKIKEKNSFKEVKDEYEKTKTYYTKYLKTLLLVNNLNVGNLCSVCIQNNVTSYYNPCGHTTCEDCKKRLIEYSGENDIMGCRCPICRVNIRDSKKIYFN